MTNYLTSAGVQQFSITIPSAAASATATITAVGSGAFILRGGPNPSTSANFGQDEGFLALTNPTTITVTRGTGSAGTTLTVKGCIVDGDLATLIKSIQFGTITIVAGNATGTASISAVTDANTAVHHLGSAMATASVSERADYPTVTLSGTTVTATLGGTAATNMTVGFVVIEFQGSCLTANGVQRVLATSSSSVTSYTASLVHNVVLNNALTILGGYNIATDTTNLAQGHQYGSLTGVGTFTVNVDTASAVAKNLAASIVEFNSGVLNSAVQRGTTTLTGVASNTSSITPVTLANSGLSWLGNSTNATTAVLDQASGAGALTNGSTVTVTKTTATSNITGSWEVFEFPPFAAASAIGWFPRYPDQVPFFNQQLPSGQAVEPVQPLNFKLPWLPRYPDQVPFFNQQLPGGVAVEPVPRVDLRLPWLPVCAPDAPRPNLKVQRDFFFAGIPPLNFVLPWLPQYADQVRPNLKVQRDFFFAGIPAVKLPIPWLPCYPDATRYFPRLQDTNQPAVFQAIATTTVLSWFPRYPDQAPLFVQQVQAGAVMPVQPLNFKLPWLPILPDASRPNVRPQRDFVFQGPIPLNLPLPWLPSYPDLYREPARVKGDSFFAPPWPLNFRLPWLPRYPDSAPAAPAVKGDYIFSPIAQVPAALLWLPISNDLIRRVDRTRSEQVFSVFTRTSALSWLPVLADAVRARRMGREESTFGPIASTPKAATALPWLPVYADPARKFTRAFDTSTVQPPPYNFPVLPPIPLLAEDNALLLQAIAEGPVMLTARDIDVQLLNAALDDFIMLQAVFDAIALSANVTED